jgi:TolB-like protein
MSGMTVTDRDESAQNTRAQSAPWVFVSHASPDAAVAKRIVAALERDGIRCWIAPRDVPAGAQYADAIVRAISEASVFLVLLSAHSIGSAHVGREVERAGSKGRRFLALRLDAAPLTPALEYFLGESQWADFEAGERAAEARLLQAIRQAPGPAIATPTQAAQSSKRTPNAIAACAAIAIVGVLAWKFLHPKAVPVPSPAPTSVAAIAEKSIAVLPFADMSEKKDQEYVGDGMAEEILDLLAKVPGLTVIGRTSSFQFKGKNEDLRTIGNKLNAAYVLEGSVRTSGDQVRITAQLINTRTGAQEWSETYDRPIGDVLKLQDAIALAVTRELQLTVVPADLDGRSALTNTGAYDLMLRGRHAFDRSDKAGFDEAASLFQQALDRDPNLADAASWLGRTYEFMGETGNSAPGPLFEQSRRMAELALKLNPRSADAHALLANIHIFYDWDWAAAEREIQQAKQIAPGDPFVQRAGAVLAVVLGRWDDALKQTKAAILVDPFDPINYVFLTHIEDRFGQWSEAEGSARRVLNISPAFRGMHAYLSYFLWKQGKRDSAMKELQGETEREARQAGMASNLYVLGGRAESDAALAEHIKGHAATDALVIAEAYAVRGRADEAMRWLERAFDQRDGGLALIKSDTLLDSLHNDPRYKALLRKMNLPEGE